MLAVESINAPPSRRFGRRRRTNTMDIIYLLTVAIFFAGAVAYAHYCDHA
ncbi:MAG: hypothetical protein ABI629_06920 [bacterium]